MAGNKTRQIAITGVFTGLIFLLGMTPIGLIPLGFINLTIVHIPVIVGAMLIDRKSALVLGGAFGLASTLAAFGLSFAAQSGLAATLLGYSPLAVIIMCIVPRMLIPITTRLMYDALLSGVSSRKNRKNRKKRARATTIAAIVGSLTNTVFYLGFMGIFFAMYGIWGKFTAIFSVTLFIGATCEAIAAALIASPVVSAISDLSVEDTVSEKPILIDDTKTQSTADDEGSIDDCSVAVIPATDTLLPTLDEQMSKRHDKCLKYLNDDAVIMAQSAFTAFINCFKSEDDIFKVSMYSVMRFIEASKYYTASKMLVSTLSKATDTMLTPENKHMLLGIMHIISTSVANDAKNPTKAKSAAAIFTDATDLVLVENLAEASKKLDEYITAVEAKDRVIQQVESEPEMHTPAAPPITPSVQIDAPYSSESVEEGISESSISTLPTAYGIKTLLPENCDTDLALGLLQRGLDAKEAFEHFVSSTDEENRINADMYVMLCYFEHGCYYETLDAILRCLKRNYPSSTLLSARVKNIIKGIITITGKSVKNMCANTETAAQSDKIIAKMLESYEKGAMPITCMMIEKYFVSTGLAK